tara:strand:- start:6583 stop:8457 length:1875 start_codon:yes stop_codon:yes gene_type:complete
LKYFSKDIIFKRIGNISPKVRKLIFILIDVLVIPIVLFFGFWIKHETPLSEEFLSTIWIIKASFLIGVPLYLFSGQYKSLTRYVGSRSLYYLISRNALLILLIIIFGKSLNLTLPSGGNLILFLILVSFISGGIRFLLRDILLYFSDFKKKNLTKIAIYGAGASGAQLEASLRLSNDYSIQFFIDDNKELWGRSLNDIPIKSIDFIQNNNQRIDQVLIAIPSLKKSNYKKILDKLSSFNISVLRIPSLGEIASGKSKINSLRPILIEDILGRDEITPDQSLLYKSTNNKSILITGSGGSIGSELARKILEINPSKLVLLERNEPSLYQIQRELENKYPNKNIISVLGSARSKQLLKNTIKKYNINLVFHAAAYKHVPLVEENPIIGLENNIFSTLNICEIAQCLNVEKVVLISSDKAVRPTNLMGVSKRISELIFQAFANNKKIKTCYSMVRFGNVLGSSGSVVPLFREQIHKGGPITITDKEMVRYFMTIEEASYLVIQASALAGSGEILLLDMGEPIFIKTLAEKMINLTGLRVKNKSHPNGDIEIIYTGKRPGEKLYEELLISAESEKTLHPLIYKARENFIDLEILLKELQNLKKYLENFDYESTFKLLENLVPEWDRDF